MPFIPIPRSEIEQPLVEPGTYNARIDKISSRKSQAGNEVMNIIWTIIGTEPPAGTKVLDGVTLTPEAYWKLDGLFKATGYTPGDSGFQTEELLGSQAKIVVVHDEYQGQKRSKVSGYLPI